MTNLLRRPPLVKVVALAVLCLAIAYRWSGLNLGVFWVDIDVYVRGAAAVIHGEDLYAVDAHGLMFTYSPFAAVLFTPFVELSVEVNRVIFTVLSLAAYATVIHVVARRLKLDRSTELLVGISGLALEPFLRGILLGQINLTLIAMVVVDLLVIRSSRRGFLVGLAAGIKLVPGVFVLYFILKRDWKSVWHSAIGFAISLVVGGVWAPGATWQYWSGGFLTMGKFGESSVFAADNQSLSAFLMRLMHASTLPVWITAVGCVLGVSFGVVAARLQMKRGDDVAAMVCLALGGLLGSPVSWSHHWIWIIVVVLVLAQRRAWLTMWVVGACFWVGPFWLLGVGDFRELGLSGGQQIVGGTYVLIGVGLLVHLSMRPRASVPLPVVLADLREAPSPAAVEVPT